ncbi:hypothetical protein [Gelidibacter maritimus]|uniref:TonB-dependent receptor plug domain-containing protein n=1 Tax=Gelidibacter maritimus TaxID=2761487 RepID=A0A7W2R3D1_9FLAO|nr:hypothetical protein [Gelidibacter maritimus]MBA6152727.1 hypothetical protein [Gelidibacter maritimus]
MKNASLFYKFLFCTVIILNGYSTVAQEKNNLLSAYQNYTGNPREVAYLHLNKSTYIKGEAIGFTAYVFDKKDKKPSNLTTNLYVSIEDKNDKTIAKKLIRIMDGVGSNTFVVDSTFTSGYYKIKAYTNWMLNFNEQNHYVESIRIIDPDTEEFISTETASNELDAQFLPESGHLLHGVSNTVGVVVKDNLGYGVPYIEGTVFGKNDEVLTSFKTNKLGIGKFPLFAELNTGYRIKLKHGNKDFDFNLNQKIEEKGVVVSLNRTKSKVFISIKTNTESLDFIKNKNYNLLLHNGDKSTLMDVNFTDNTTVTIGIELASASSGVNILTLFNENNQPIAERLFFKYEGINLLKSNEISTSKTTDSIAVALNFKNIDADALSNISISVLPEATKSYNKDHNIVSYLYLQPYVNGPIEQAKYYFTDIDAKKQFELDNLLLTQGWSSYHWNTIFNAPERLNYTFEQGIRYKVNINSSSNELTSSYLMHAVGETDPQTFRVNRDQKNFMIDNVFPMENDRLYLSKVKSNGELGPAKLYIQSFPSAIPKLSAESDYLNPKFDYNISTSLNNAIQFEKLNDMQQLDEITVSTRVSKTKTRIQKLGEHKYGKIKIVEEIDRMTFNTLTDFLHFHGITSDESEGGFSLFVGSKPLRNNSTANYGAVTLKHRSSSPPPTDIMGTSEVRVKPMAVFLDDIQLVDHSILNQYPLNNVDYVEINKRGIGGGLRGASGVVKIYSYYGSDLQDNRKTGQGFELPLAFSPQKIFYVPKYQYYTDDFYKQYGTVDWKPKLVPDANGNIEFTIAKPKVPVTLFIEGSVSDGSIIYEEKSIALDLHY